MSILSLVSVYLIGTGVGWWGCVLGIRWGKTGGKVVIYVQMLEGMISGLGWFRSYHGLYDMSRADSGLFSTIPVLWTDHMFW